MSNIFDEYINDLLKINPTINDFFLKDGYEDKKHIQPNVYSEEYYKQLNDLNKRYLRTINKKSKLSFHERIFKQDLKDSTHLEEGYKIYYYMPIDIRGNIIIDYVTECSGNGFFIEECEKSNIDITGSEADEEQYNLLAKNFSNIIKIALPIKNFNNELSNKFDVVVFNDVFEHLENLDLILIQLKSILKTNGQIVINLPSSDGLIYKFSNILNKIGFTNFYDRLWQKKLASPHLSYFNNSNLKMLFNKHGYNLIHTTSLDTVSKKGNFIRLNSTIKYKFICFLLSGLLFLFYYFQKILPKDIILHIYKRP